MQYSLTQHEQPKLLITGADGQVGLELQRAAQDSGFRIWAGGRAQLDITDMRAVSEAFASVKPDVVINAAAYTAVDKAESEVDLCFSINRDGPANLAAACGRAGIPLLHISTDYVFDGSKPGAYTEDDAAAPLGAYGESKWQGDLAVRERLAQHLILRVSWVFSRHGHNFVKTMLRLGKERDELRVVADQCGSPTAARDIASALMELARRALRDDSMPWGTYHYSSLPATTWHGFAQAILSEACELGLLNRVPVVHAITTEEYPTPAKRPANSLLDSSKLTNTFGIHPPRWRDSLIEVLKELQG